MILGREYTVIYFNLFSLLSNPLNDHLWAKAIGLFDKTESVHETNLFQVKKLKEKIGSRKRICTVVQKEIGTQTETKVQRTIQTQTLYNIQEPNRNVSFQISFQNITRIAHITTHRCSRYSGDIYVLIYTYFIK